MALLSLLLNTARIKEPRAAPVQARRTIQTAGCPAKIEEPKIDVHDIDSSATNRHRLNGHTDAYPLELANVEGDLRLGEGEDTEGPTSLDRQILTLLLAGLSDQITQTGPDAAV